MFGLLVSKLQNGICTHQFKCVSEDVPNGPAALGAEHQPWASRYPRAYFT